MTPPSSRRNQWPKPPQSFKRKPQSKSRNHQTMRVLKKCRLRKHQLWPRKPNKRKLQSNRSLLMMRVLKKSKRNQLLKLLLGNQWSLPSQLPRSQWKNLHPRKNLLKRSPSRKLQLWPRKPPLFKNKSKKRKAPKNHLKKSQSKKPLFPPRSQSKKKNPLKKNPQKTKPQLNLKPRPPWSKPKPPLPQLPTLTQIRNSKPVSPDFPTMLLKRTSNPTSTPSPKWSQLTFWLIVTLEDLKEWLLSNSTIRRVWIWLYKITKPSIWDVGWTSNKPRTAKNVRISNNLNPETPALFSSEISVSLLKKPPCKRLSRNTEIFWESESQRTRKVTAEDSGISTSAIARKPTLLLRWPVKPWTEDRLELISVNLNKVNYNF